MRARDTDRKTKFRIGSAAVLMLLAGVASAQETPAALDAVVVTASRTSTALGDTPAAITRLDNEAVRDSKPRLISDVIDRVPGVHMVDLGNEQHSMSIRQPITTGALYQYLEDNIPIRPLGVFNHNALNEINLSGIDSLEVMRGPTSSLYGSNAVGGAVNFLTAAPSLTPEAWAGLRGSDQGYTRLDAGVSGTAGDLGARLSYYRSEVNGGWRDFSDSQKDSLSARVDYVVSDASLLKTVASYTDLYTDMTGSLGETDYQQQPEKSYQTFTERTDVNSRISSSLETEWSEDTSSRVTLFWRDNSHGQIPSYSLGSCVPVAPATTCTTNGRQNDNSYTSYGVDSQISQALDFLDARLIVGGGWDHTRNDYDEDNLSVLRDTALRYRSYTVTSKRRRYDALIDNPSLYLQGEIKPLEKTTLVLGGRYDLIRYDFDNHLLPSGSTGAPDEKREFSHFSPRAGAAYALAQDAEIFLNLSEGFVPPEVSQLYSSLDVPDLRESTFRNVDLGFRRRWPEQGKLEVTLYRLEGEDEIVSYTVQTTPTLIRENRNASATLHEGLEVGGEWTLLQNLSAYASYTWARHEYADYRPSPAEDYSGNDMAGAPENMALLGANLQLTEQLTLAPEVQHIGAYWMNELNSVRYPGHLLGHLRARWQQDAWEVFAQLLNVADVHYAHSASSSYRSGVFNPDVQNSYTPGDPRTFLLGFQYHLGQ